MDKDISRGNIVGKMQREKTMMRGCELPVYDEDDEIHYETFFHQDGNIYTCYFKSGERFLIDLKTNKSTEFPRRWYAEGLVVMNNLVDDFPPEDKESQKIGFDDREGIITLSENKILQTYLFQEKINVHCYFDNASGTWIRLPLAWELQSEFVKNLITSIQDVIPEWKDKYSILASLRAHDYDPQLCSTAYYSWGTSDNWQITGSNEDALNEKEELIKKLKIDLLNKEKSIEKQAALLNKAKSSTKELQEKNNKLEENVEDLKVELKRCQTNLDVLSAQQVTRPKSAAINIQQVVPELVKNQICAVYKEASNLGKEKMRLQREFTSSIDGLTSLLLMIKHGVGRINTNEPSLATELEEMKMLYKREALQRKLLYNELQELRGNIRVFLRCRKDVRSNCCLDFPSDEEVYLPGAKKSFKFDKVFGPDSTQQEVYKDTQPIIASCADGYNVCIMAYGQTGSGKTHTMQGPPEDPGVNVRSLNDLLKICQERNNIEYKLKASMIEIYNECINDLLSEVCPTLDIRSQGNKTILPGIVEMTVESIEHIENIIQIGSKNRKVASTKMNSQSSRSHLIFLITVEGRDVKTGALSLGTLTLCDLAGSERVSKTEATGQRLVEAAAINKSLSSLGQVFSALKNSQLHIPYRNSKLTHLLQNTLGGNAKACLFVMVSPDSSNFSETQSTIQFGSNALQVQLGQAKKNINK